ncbi:MAG: DUF6161 domain-containing protein [Planctomycetota bacterium]
MSDTNHQKEQQAKSLNVNLGKEVGDRTFNDRAEVRDFIAAEKKAADYLFGSQEARNPTNLRSTLVASFEQFEKRWNQNESTYAAFEESGDVDNMIKVNRAAESLLSSFFGGTDWILSESRRGRFLTLLGNRNYSMEARRAVAAAFRGKSPNSSEPRIVIGTCLAAAFAAGYTPQPEIEAGHAEALQRLNTAKTQLQQDGDQLRRINLKSLQNQRESYRRRRAAIDREWSSRLRDLDSAFDAKLAYVDRVINEYTRQLQFDEPRLHWTLKQRYHYLAASILGLVFFVSIAAALYGGYYFVEPLLLSPGEIAVAAGEANPSTSATVLIRRLAIVGLFASVAFIWLRLVIKLLLSQLHLASDAGERVTLIKTYLAFSVGKDDDDQTIEADRTLLLNTIFRTTSSGLIKDDALPPGVLDLVTRVSADASRPPRSTG